MHHVLRTTLQLFKLVKINVFCHIYYRDLFVEIASNISKIPKVFVDTICFNIVEMDKNEDLEFSSKIKSYFPESIVLITKNIGRDTGGLLRMLSFFEEKNLFKDENLSIVLHSKKSSYLKNGKGDIWRRELVDGILGDQENICKIYHSFLNFSNIGMVGAKQCVKTNLGGVKYSDLKRYCKILNIKMGDKFIGGTMFWIRNRSLSRIVKLAKQFWIEMENDYYDGFWDQRMYSLERVFGYLVSNDNLKILGNTDIEFRVYH